MLTACTIFIPTQGILLQAAHAMKPLPLTPRTLIHDRTFVCVCATSSYHTLLLALTPLVREIDVLKTFSEHITC
jgi:hypothetical protein